MRFLALLTLVGCSSNGLLFDPSDLRSEQDVGVSTPSDWDFLFALDMSEIAASGLDADLRIPSALIENLDSAGAELENAIVIARVDDVEGYGSRLRYATKGSLSDGAFTIDRSADSLGSASGSQGGGVYAAYHAHQRVGFITGSVSDCAGAVASDVLVTATNSPFFSRSMGDGRWGVPAVTVNAANAADVGVPITVHFETEGCTGQTSVGTGSPLNPKTGETPYEQEETEDGTVVIDVPEVIMDDDHSGRDAPPKGEGTAFVDFEDDWSGGTFHGSAMDCTLTAGDIEVGVEQLSTAYSTLFEGDESRYLWMSTGGNQEARSTLKCQVVVPDAATTLELGYNFLSQEYPEWVGSGFNDAFTVTVSGSPEVLINRTINNAAEDELWTDADDEVADLGGIADSADALYNAAGSRFDGLLHTDRTGPELDEVAETNTFDLSTFAGEEITLILSVSDVGDHIYDSAVAIDGIYIY